VSLARQLGLKTGFPLSKVVEMTRERRKIGGAEVLCPPRGGHNTSASPDRLAGFRLSLFQHFAPQDGVDTALIALSL